jgi:hypothetical protein
LVSSLAGPRGVELDHVPVGIEEEYLGETGLPGGILSQPLHLVSRIRAIPTCVQDSQRLAIALHPQREVRIVGVNASRTQGWPFVDDEVELPSAEVVPRAREVEGRALDLSEPQDVLVKRLGPLEVRDGEADVVQVPDLDHRILYDSGFHPRVAARLFLSLRRGRPVQERLGEP